VRSEHIALMSRMVRDSFRKLLRTRCGCGRAVEGGEGEGEGEGGGGGGLQPGRAVVGWGGFKCRGAESLRALHTALAQLYCRKTVSCCSNNGGLRLGGRTRDFGPFFWLLLLIYYRVLAL
jgi:hypothetical protein